MKCSLHLTGMRPVHQMWFRPVDLPNVSCYIIPPTVSLLFPEEAHICPRNLNLRIGEHNGNHRLQELRLPPVIVFEKREKGSGMDLKNKLNVRFAPRLSVWFTTVIRLSPIRSMSSSRRRSRGSSLCNSHTQSSKVCRTRLFTARTSNWGRRNVGRYTLQVAMPKVAEVGFILTRWSRTGQGSRKEIGMYNNSHVLCGSRQKQKRHIHNGVQISGASNASSTVTFY